MTTWIVFCRLETRTENTTTKNKVKSEYPSVLNTERDLIFDQLQKFLSSQVFEEQYLSSLLVEYLRFINIKKSRPTMNYQPSELVDAMWHAHIICTKIYHTFCDRCNNGEYIHHTPDNRNNTQTYKNTLQAYSKEYGCDPDPIFWPPYPSAKVSNDKRQSTKSKDPVVTVQTENGVHILKLPQFHTTLEELGKVAQPSGLGQTVPEKVAMCQINALQKLKIIFEFSEVRYKDAENGMFSYIGEQATSTPGCPSNAIFFCQRCCHIWEFGFCNRDNTCLDCSSRKGAQSLRTSSDGNDDGGNVDYIVRCFGCG